MSTPTATNPLPECPENRGRMTSGLLASIAAAQPAPDRPTDAVEHDGARSKGGIRLLGFAPLLLLPWLCWLVYHNPGLIGIRVQPSATTYDSVEVTEAERSLMVTAAELSRATRIEAPDSDDGEFAKYVRSDGLGFLTYEYAAETDATGPSSVWSSVSSHTTDTEAKRVYYGISRDAQRIGGSTGREKDELLERRSDLIRWGDAHEFFIIRRAGRPVGNAFFVLDGKTFFYFHFRGVGLDDPERIRELLVPKLEALRNYRP